MTLLGELFGYDSRDNDILGGPRDPKNACPICGISAYFHSPEMNAECTWKLYGGGQVQTQKTEKP